MAIGSEQQQGGTSRDQVVEAFVAAWNTADEAERRRLLERSWAEDGVFVHPSGQFERRDGLASMMRSFVESWPAGSQARISRVEEHHGWLYYSWKIVRTDGSVYAVGLQLAERASDGRLRRMINFAGAIPEIGGCSPRAPAIVTSRPRAESSQRGRGDDLINAWLR